MSYSRRLSRLGLALATGLIAIVGFVPSGAVASGSADSGVVHSIPAKNGEGWCC